MLSLETLGPSPSYSFFFFNDTATTEIYTLSLHDALPISLRRRKFGETSSNIKRVVLVEVSQAIACRFGQRRSEEHTSELQSQSNLVCRLLLEKKNNRRVPLHFICKLSLRKRIQLFKNYTA